MTLAYLDTSAAMKLLYQEDGASAMGELFADPAGPTFVSSWLLHTELHCAANRRGGAEVRSISRVLSGVNLVDLARGHLVSAGALAPLRAQDAIHLAVALSLTADQMITYDDELAAAAERAGLLVVSPGIR
ncbi:type II toxin-antitoxin system VapC family toxin [uncultured Microbacterium sp.]|uniref:type II toxin-antitoxin system VapC family toxin n=1 Tax=uncultured Microbacterium sp. TaxID=191216 RepID=UPI00260B88B5|nr:type II toxin-antitoxin system VapC family toxin [uncultured Microbacterium sp.]